METEESKTNKKQTGRGYIKITDQAKQELAFRSIILGESAVQVCKELNINYYTAKNLLGVFKSTGQFTKVKGHKIIDSSGGTRCPLRIRIEDEGKMRLYYSTELPYHEQQNLWRLHYENVLGGKYSAIKK